MSLPTILATAGVACKAREEGRKFKVLTQAEANNFEAIAARIIPSDDSPGATEAGVIYFIDAALAGIRSEALDPLRKSLAKLQSLVHKNYGVESFSQLDQARQIKILKTIERTRFFDTMRFLTVAGMFSLPSYGGNRDKIGWKLLGFEHRAYWQPPFGYYDADYADKDE